MLTFADATDLDTLRLRGEFVAMPGLVINSAQVARLLGVRIQRATLILEALEREAFLVRMAGGSYRRRYPLPV